MKILVVHNAYRQKGGEDAVVRAEAALLRDHGHMVRSYGRGNDELRGRAPAGAAFAALWSRGAAADIDAICRAFAPDVIHVHNTFFVISPAVYWIAARRRIPVVQTLHNFRLLCPQGTFLRGGMPCEDCLGKVPWRAVSRACYRGSAAQSALLAGVLAVHAGLGTYRDKVTRYIAMSTFARDRFVAGGLPPERIRIKPNFVDGVTPPGDQPRRGGLYVGRLSREKGIETLLDALDLCPLAEMDVVGTGPLGDLAARRLGACAGFAAAPEVARRMRAAAFLVVPSIGHEQMPMTVLEAFAHGLPVIASRRGALADIVRPGVTGLLAEPGNPGDLADKMRWALAHPARMAQMGHAARIEYERNYTAPINHDILMDIYEDAIAAVRDGDPVAHGTDDPRHVDRRAGLG